MKWPVFSQFLASFSGKKVLPENTIASKKESAEKTNYDNLVTFLEVQCKSGGLDKFSQLCYSLPEDVLFKVLKNKFPVGIFFREADKNKMSSDRSILFIFLFKNNFFESEKEDYYLKFIYKEPLFSIEKVFSPLEYLVDIINSAPNDDITKRICAALENKGPKFLQQYQYIFTGIVTNKEIKAKIESACLIPVEKTLLHNIVKKSVL